MNERIPIGSNTIPTEINQRLPRTWPTPAYADSKDRIAHFFLDRHSGNRLKRHEDREEQTNPFRPSYLFIFDIYNVPPPPPPSTRPSTPETEVNGGRDEVKSSFQDGRR